MKTKNRLTCLAAALALSLGFSLRADAESPRDELSHAYRLVSRANGDYAGHRQKAMDEIGDAARELGLPVEGELSTGERQWKADQQMTEARRLLSDARDKLEDRDRTRVASHVESAIREIDAALKHR